MPCFIEFSRISGKSPREVLKQVQLLQPVRPARKVRWLSRRQSKPDSSRNSCWTVRPELSSDDGVS